MSGWKWASIAKPDLTEIVGKRLEKHHVVEQVYVSACSRFFLPLWVGLQRFGNWGASP